jgi:hypothetical protein
MRTTLLVLLVLALAAPPAGATTVAFVDGNAVWLASPDGTQRRQLAGATSDGRVWRELTQSDNGRVLAVRREPGKISQLNSFTLWGPDGAVIHEGSLTHQLGWSTYVYPVTLDLTADGSNVVYGYSNMTGVPPMYQFDRGTYVMYADRAPASEPFGISGQEWPTVVGNRIVAGYGGTVSTQRTDGALPWSTDFDPWLDLSGTGLVRTRTDVAASGTVAAVELVEWTGGTRTQGKIAMLSIEGPGGALRGGDCFLPAQGVADDVSLSQDGTLLAWQDDRGVVVAGMPDFSGAEPCTLTKPPVVISATGTMPSLGPAVVSSPAPPPAPPAGGGGPVGTPGGTASAALKATVPARVKAAALRTGLRIRVRVGAGGPVTIVGRVRGKVVARGSAKAKGAGTIVVRLRATRAARKRLARLRGRTLVVRVTAGGRSTTVRRKLR